MTIHDQMRHQISESGEERRGDMLAVALKLATTNGWHTLTHAHVARELEVDRALVNYYLGNKSEFRDKVMAAAVAGKVVPVVAEGMIYHNAVALEAPATLRKAAKAHIDATGMKLPRWRKIDDNGEVVHAWYRP